VRVPRRPWGAAAASNIIGGRGREARAAAPPAFGAILRRRARRSRPMSFFEQYQGSRLYLASFGGADAGWLAYQFPQGFSLPGDGVDLADALGKYPGSFVFSATAPDFSASGALDRFIGAVDAVVQATPSE